MKKLYYLPFLFFIVGLAVWPATLYSQKEVATSDEAKLVLERYFYCLINGDTSGILDLITGPLLKKRERILRNNTQYGSFLRERYKDTTFLITSGVFTTNNLLSLRASIFFDDQHKTDFIFNFVSEGSNGSLKIYSEEEVP